MSLLSSITAPLKSGLSSATSFVVTGAATKLTEGVSSVIGSLGGVGAFKKAAANVPTFDQMTADIIRGEDPLDSRELIGDVMQDVNRAGEGAASASAVNSATGGRRNSSKHRVTLTEVGASTDSNPTVFFNVMPEITEQHTVEYDAIAPPQFPGTFQKYKGNAATQWTLNATFISRTESEATTNYKYLQKLRGWTKPYYGSQTGENFPGKLGAPPPVLMLEGLRTLIGPVPVVITALNWNWPKDVDYIATGIAGPDGKPIPFPTVLQVPVQLVESYSIQQFNEFSLAHYREGNLGQAFNASQRQGGGDVQRVSRGAYSGSVAAGGATEAASKIGGG